MRCLLKKDKTNGFLVLRESMNSAILVGNTCVLRCRGLSKISELFCSRSSVKISVTETLSCPVFSTKGELVPTNSLTVLRLLANKQQNLQLGSCFYGYGQPPIFQ
jgi:hypothetical protein